MLFGSSEPSKRDFLIQLGRNGVVIRESVPPKKLDLSETEWIIKLNTEIVRITSLDEFSPYGQRMLRIRKQMLLTDTNPIDSKYNDETMFCFPNGHISNKNGICGNILPYNFEWLKMKRTHEDVITCHRVAMQIADMMHDECITKGCLIGSMLLQEVLSNMGIKTPLVKGFLITMSSFACLHIWVVDKHGNKYDVGTMSNIALSESGNLSECLSTVSFKLTTKISKNIERTDMDNKQELEILKNLENLYDKACLDVENCWTLAPIDKQLFRRKVINKIII